MLWTFECAFQKIQMTTPKCFHFHVLSSWRVIYYQVSSMPLNTGGALSWVGEQVKFEQKINAFPPPPPPHGIWPCTMPGKKGIEFGWGREIELNLHCTFDMGEFRLFSFFFFCLKTIILEQLRQYKRIKRIRECMVISNKSILRCRSRGLIWHNSYRRLVKMVQLLYSLQINK